MFVELEGKNVHPKMKFSVLFIVFCVHHPKCWLKWKRCANKLQCILQVNEFCKIEALFERVTMPVLESSLVMTLMKSSRCLNKRTLELEI